jgi:hypothetical protein
MIGTIRRACLAHVIVLNEASLRRILSGFPSYYAKCKTHLSLEKDAPEPRPVQPPESGNVVAIPEVGGFPIATSGSRPEIVVQSPNSPQSQYQWPIAASIPHLAPRLRTYSSSPRSTGQYRLAPV